MQLQVKITSAKLDKANPSKNRSSNHYWCLRKLGLRKYDALPTDTDRVSAFVADKTCNNNSIEFVFHLIQ